MKETDIVKESALLGESYTYRKHSSGLSIYVFPKKLSTTYALLATEFGSVDVATDEGGLETLPDGVAHFLEHKLFTNEDGSDAFEHFSAFGADANAYTSHTRTVYLFSCTDRFSDSLGELIDFVTNPYFTKESVAKEQGIIGEEIRMCGDNPYDRCYFQMLQGLYAEHPVRIDICGSVSSIARITPEVLYRAYKTFYRLSNMTLVVCGDVTSEEVFAIADKHLPKTGDMTPPPRGTVAEDATAFRSLVEGYGQVAKPVFSIGIKDTALPRDPLARLKRDAGMAILNEMLFSPAGELYEQLFDEGMISPELSANYSLTRDFAFNQISGEADDPVAVQEKIFAYIEKMQKNGLDAADFERCRRIEYAEYIKSFDSTEEIANTLLSFASESVEYFSYPSVLESIDLTYVEGLLASCYSREYCTLSVIYPNKKES